MHQPLMGMMTTPVFVDGVEVGDFVVGGVPVFYVGSAVGYDSTSGSNYVGDVSSFCCQQI